MFLVLHLLFASALDASTPDTGIPRRYPAHEDMLVKKVDTSGHSLWSHFYGGERNDHGFWIEEIRDGGFIITGYTESFGAGGADVWLLRLDSLGDSVWARTYGGIGKDLGYEVHQTFDGGYVIVGSTESFGVLGSDLWLLKTDTAGDTLWTRRYGFEWNDWGASVAQAPDGGFMVAGTTEGYRYKDMGFFLLGKGPNPDTIWQGNGRSQYYLWDISMGTDFDSWILRTDASGDTLWTMQDGSRIDSTYGESVQYLPDAYAAYYNWDTLSHVTLDTSESFPTGAYVIEKYITGPRRISHVGHLEFLIDDKGNILHEGPVYGSEPYELGVPHVYNGHSSRLRGDSLHFIVVDSYWSHKYGWRNQY
ncbi:hypothetical protein JXM67_09765 [candidate division WOR-3 bacterium]|nr:hypothetical protein [candidate division WOR-3 bacterium]